MTTQSIKSSGDNGSAAAAMTGDGFWPPQEVVRQANVPDWEAVARRAAKDLPGFWEEQAREVEWYGAWTSVLDESEKQFYKWFNGARVNIIHNCLDRYQNTATRNKTALIWEGENGDARELSYATLHREVSRFGNVLKKLGVVKGDRVTIYMGRVPEIIVAMLACAKIGAIHSVAYVAFSLDSLAVPIHHNAPSVPIPSSAPFS